MNFEWLVGFPEMGMALIHAAAYVALVWWVFTRPRTEDEAREQSGWRDLRLWIVPLAALQVLLYFLF